MKLPIYVGGWIKNRYTHCNINNKGIYLKTTGPTSLSYNGKEIQNHGIEYHSEGFGSPIGVIISEYLKVANFFLKESQKSYLNAILEKVSKVSRVTN